VGKKSGPPDCHDNDDWWFGAATVPKKAQLPRTDAILRPKDKRLQHGLQSFCLSMYIQNLCQSWLTGDIEPRLALILN
jgi:hypothetical protein